VTDEEALDEIGTVSITMADASNTPLNELDNGFEVFPDTLVRLIAEPAAGHKFVKWTREGSTAAALDEESGLLGERYTFNDTEQTEYFSQILELPATQAGLYTAVFAEAEMLSEDAGLAFLQGLTVEFPTDRNLVKDGNDEVYPDNNFDYEWLHYNVYLTKEETTAAIRPAYASDYTHVKYVIGEDRLGAYADFADAEFYEVADYNADAGSTDYFTAADPILVSVEDPEVPQVLNILVAENDLIGEATEPNYTIYTVTVHRRAAAEEWNETEGRYEPNFKEWETLNPQVILELDATTGKKQAMVNVYIAEARVSAGEFTLKMSKNVEVDGKTVAGFEGFANIDGELLKDGTHNSDVITVNAGASHFAVDKVKVWTDEEDAVYMTLTFGSNAGNFVTVVGKKTMFFQFYIIKTDASTTGDTDSELLETLSVPTEYSSVLVDNYFGNLLYREETETLTDSEGSEVVAAAEIREENRLVYIRRADKYYITAYVNGRPDGAHRTTFNVYDEVVVGDMVDEDSKTLNDLPIALQTGNKLFYTAANGSFIFVISSPGFIEHQTKSILVNNDNRSLMAINMVGGDVDGNGVIDAIDRNALIKVMDGDVITNDEVTEDVTRGGGAAGDVRLGTKYYHADLNDDNVVNAFDLGVVLNGIQVMAEEN
jgi:hypothetical protein